MAPIRGRSYPLKRAAPEVATDVGPAHGGTISDIAQSDKDREIETLKVENQRLRLENQRLQEEVARDKNQSGNEGVKDAKKVE